MSIRPNHHDEPTEAGTYVGSSTVADGADEVVSRPQVVVDDKYRLLRRIGTGGMGDVYLAEHMVIGKQVAVKFLKRDLASVPNHAARFLQEARAASSIRHEHVVDITDFGRTPDGQPFFVMELLEGESLRDLLRREGPLRWERARELIVQVLDGLGAAHAKNIIHRDIKPENCFCVLRPGRPPHLKILDFSIAKIKGADAASLTSTGAPIGTVYYMSPEQAQGERDIDLRTDVYSCGAMLYEMLTGEVPFSADNIYGVLYKIVNQEPPSVELLSADAGLRRGAQEVLQRTLAKDREQRFASVLELRSAIEGVRSTDVENIGNATTMLSLGAGRTAPQVALSPAPTRRRGLLAGAGVVVALVAIATAVWSTRGDGPSPATPPTNAAPVATLPSAPVVDKVPPSEPERPQTAEPSAGTPAEPPAGEASSPAEPTPSKPEIPAATQPERRTEAQLRRGLRGVDAKIEGCRKFALGDVVEVTFTIAPSGAVTTSEAQGPHRTSPLGTCVTTAVRAARFGPASKDQRVKRKFTF